MNTLPWFFSILQAYSSSFILDLIRIKCPNAPDPSFSMHSYSVYKSASTAFISVKFLYTFKVVIIIKFYSSLFFLFLFVFLFHSISLLIIVQFFIHILTLLVDFQSIKKGRKGQWKLHLTPFDSVAYVKLYPFTVIDYIWMLFFI